MDGRPTVILDAMGAEMGGEEVVRGAAQACAASRGNPFDLVLVTTEPEQMESHVDRLLSKAANGSRCNVEILPAEDHIPETVESPVEVYKKHPNLSIRVAMDRAKATAECAVVSPGNTGLVMTSAVLTLGRVKGIERPPIGTPMPTLGKELFFVDGGSNVDCRASHLYQFAVLAHLYVKAIGGVQRPSIALLSNGSEAYKGNAVVREAYSLLSEDRDLNFVGFTEGHTALAGELDIMVCDGFLGNIFLKAAEGVAETMKTMLREEIKASYISALAAKTFMGGAFARFARRIDYAQFGGAPLLGLNGNVVICHGRSTAIAIKNALLLGCKLARSGISKLVARYLQDHYQLVKV